MFNDRAWRVFLGGYFVAAGTAMFAYCRSVAISGWIYDRRSVIQKFMRAVLGGSPLSLTLRLVLTCAGGMWFQLVGMLFWLDRIPK